MSDQIHSKTNLSDTYFDSLNKLSVNLPRSLPRVEVPQELRDRIAAFGNGTIYLDDGVDVYHA